MKSRSYRISDTSPEAERVMYDVYRRMPAWRKAELVDDASRTCRLLAFSGIRSRHPDEPMTRSRRRLLGMVLGEVVASRIYGPMTNDSE